MQGGTYVGSIEHRGMFFQLFLHNVIYTLENKKPENFTMKPGNYPITNPETTSNPALGTAPADPRGSIRAVPELPTHAAYP